jgi:uncharacterized protein (DUF433 family)
MAQYLNRKPIGAAVMAQQLLSEAETMARVPGIVFVDAPHGGRVARIAGTGLEVFEVASQYRWNGQDLDLLKVASHWLSDAQIRAALDYAGMFHDEIDPLQTASEALHPPALCRGVAGARTRMTDQFLPT